MTYIFTTLKNLWASLHGSPITKAIIAIWMFFGGIHLYIYSVLALTILDVITGIMASNKKGIGFSSRLLRKGLLEKTALYLVLMLSVFVLDTLTTNLIGHSRYFFVFIITFLISCYEVSSIIENIAVVRPNIPFLSGLVRIFKKMGAGTVDKLEAQVDTITGGITGENGDKPSPMPTPTN
jgi:toxin secretion/phage lysis holin